MGTSTTFEKCTACRLGDVKGSRDGGAAAGKEGGGGKGKEKEKME